MAIEILIYQIKEAKDENALCLSSFLIFVFYFSAIAYKPQQSKAAVLFGPCCIPTA